MNEKDFDKQLMETLWRDVVYTTDTTTTTKPIHTWYPTVTTSRGGITYTPAPAGVRHRHWHFSEENDA